MIKEFSVESKKVKNYQTSGLSLTCTIDNDITNEVELHQYILDMQEYCDKLATEQLNKVTK